MIKSKDFKQLISSWNAFCYQYLRKKVACISKGKIIIQEDDQEEEGRRGENVTMNVSCILKKTPTNKFNYNTYLLYFNDIRYCLFIYKPHLFI